MYKLSFDRRDLLKGLLALPGAAAVGGLMSSCTKNENVQPKSDSAPQSSKSNVAPTIVDFSVVVHGTCAVQFDTQNKQVQILIPGVEPHQYLNGFLFNEKPF